MRKALIEINKKKIGKKFLFFLILLFYQTNIYSFENKILFKLENEIITTIDIINEKKFLNSINPKIKNLEDEQIFKISKNSILRQKIKKIELLKNNVDLKIEDKFLNKLIKSNYAKAGIKNLNEFNEYMENFDINTDSIKEKMIIEALWNELIFRKYASKIRINKEELKNEILNNKSETISYHLYEILFNVSDSSKLAEQYKIIEENIKKSTFENAALIHSTSETSKIGGDLGWINEHSLNKNIKKLISKLELNEYTKPILSSSGFLILMVKDKKKIENKINLDTELKKMINLKTNQQFMQFSNMYFNRIKKDISINEL